MLSQTIQEHRAVFLQLFAKEIINAAKKQSVPEKIKEITKPDALTEPAKSEYIPSILKEIIERSKEQKEQEKFRVPSKIEQLKKPIEFPARPIMPEQPIRQAIQISRQAFQPAIPKTRFTFPVSKPQAIPISPIAAAAGIDLGRLNPILSDKSVTIIECTGSGKPIIIRKAGIAIPTRISLSQDEISQIVSNFSQKARIPVLRGVFKASVGNLTISAVISEFVGTRFIISIASPYSLLETAKPKQPNLPSHLKWQD